METSKNINLAQVKSISLLDILNSIKKGKNPSQISKELNVSKQRLNPYIASLKKQGLIKRIGYGVWEVDTLQEVKQVKVSTKDTTTQPGTSKKEVRGHAFIWKVQLPNKRRNIDWRGLFKELGIDYKEVGLKNTPRIFIENRKVWFGKENIIIYEPASFFDVNAIESRKLAVFKLIDLLKKIENKIGFSLSPYRFSPRREHYALIKNSLAIQCRKDGTKLNINVDGRIFVVDNSYNLDEAETQGKDPLVHNLEFQNYMKENVETKWEVTPKFVLNSFGKLAEQNILLAKNIEAHLSVINEIRSLVKVLEDKEKRT